MIAALSFKSQISDLRFEIMRRGSKERKVRTPEGSEPANGGASREFQISDFKFEISDQNSLDDDKCNREETSRPRFRF